MDCQVKLKNFEGPMDLLLFAEPESLTEARFNQIIQETNPIVLQTFIDELDGEYEEAGKGLIIRKIGDGYQILSLPEYQIFIERLFNKSRKLQLTRTALEALLIVSHRQTVSKAEIESIWGVECGSVISKLMESEFITEKGRGKSAGRPLLFGATRQFLEAFGLNKTSDLPKLNELSIHMGDNPDPLLFDENYASE